MKRRQAMGSVTGRSRAKPGEAGRSRAKPGEAGRSMRDDTMLTQC
jgi:hypothetical protein